MLSYLDNHHFLFYMMIVAMTSIDPLPSIRLRNKGVTNRKDKLGLWSAVALQQHFALSCTPQVGVIDVNVLPATQPHGRLTLAQKMGLVPHPPSAPTEESWKQIEMKAELRSSEMKLNNCHCSICLESFCETMHQGQIILSCSHVFHELCFRQFEMFTRRQQRTEGENFPGILACPECRRRNYHKRVYFAGKSLAQRAAIIKIQSAMRGFLARRGYLKLRLREDSDFRASFLQLRLERLSRSWDIYLKRREEEREAIVTNIDAKKQEALAAYLTEADWNVIINKRIIDDKLAQCERSLIADRSEVSENSEEFSECPICLREIERQIVFQSDNNEQVSSLPDYGERVVASFRREYEEKKRRASNVKKGNPKGTSRKGTQRTDWQSVKDKTDKKVCFSLHDREEPSNVISSSFSDAVETACYAVPPGTSEKKAHSNVILSCGHCFHSSCLHSFEGYSQWRTNQNGMRLTNRCPLCRAGYAEHPF